MAYRPATWTLLVVSWSLFQQLAIWPLDFFQKQKLERSEALNSYGLPWQPMLEPVYLWRRGRLGGNSGRFHDVSVEVTEQIRALLTIEL